MVRRGLTSSSLMSLADAHHDGDARAIVDRADSRIPGIEVRAENHDFIGEVGARNFADHVGRARLAAGRASCS